MAIKSRFYNEGDTVDYTPVSAGTAGDIVFQGSYAGQVVSQLDAGQKGALRIRGIITVNKDSGTFAAGQIIGWNTDGTDVGAATGGAATSTTASIDFVLGRCIEAASGGATTCKVDLNNPSNFPKQAITNSTTGTAATTLATWAGTNVSAAEIAAFNNNFASIFQILQKAGVVA